MNPEPTPADPPPGDAAWRFAGHWFICLGLASVAAIPVSWILLDRASFDFSCVLMFWLGSALFKRARAAWRIAVGLCVAFLAFAVAMVVTSFLGMSDGATVLGAKNPAPDLALVAFGAFASMLIPPLILLLRPEARRLAGVPAAPRSPGRFTAHYVVGLVLLVSGGVSFSKIIRKESLEMGVNYITDARGEHAWTSHVVREDGRVPPWSSTELWIVTLGRTQSHSGVSDTSQDFEVNGVRFGIKPARSWVFIPPQGPKEPNVFLLGENGRRIAVSRRVTPATMPAAEAAANGFTDLADLERRLLSALPE